MATLLQEITHSSATKVDRDAGIIRGVKVLGRDSKNGRSYSDAALQEAAKLYDRRDVNLNHPPRDKANSERPVQDMFGWLESVEVKSDGVYADLHYATSHPMAAAIAEVAEKNPMRLGLSHNAEGTVAKRNGKHVVESIQSVRSVDLVQTPATVSGLFESTDNSKPRKKCREVLEAFTDSSLPPLPGEDEDLAPIDTPQEPQKPTGPTPEEIALAESKAALTQVFSAALMAEGDLNAVLGKVVELASMLMGRMAQPEEQPIDPLATDEESGQMDEGSGPDDEDEDEEAGDDFEPETTTEFDPTADGQDGEHSADDEEEDPFFGRKKKAMAESNRSSTTDKSVQKLSEQIAAIAKRLDERDARDSAVSLLESSNVEATPVRIAALLKAATDDDRKSLVESWPVRERANRMQRPAIRTALQESASETKYPDEHRSFVAALRR